jgi:hypothetical protein
MRFPFSLRASRACARAALFFFLGLSPSYAHMGGGPGPVARPGPGFGHSQHFAPHEFNRRFETGRSGFNHFGPNRFNRYGFDQFNRFGFDRFGWNSLFFGGGWGWGNWDGAGPAAAPLVIGEGAPVIINIGGDPGSGDVAGALNGGCVIHKLNYDSGGKYVGERQIPHC